MKIFESWPIGHIDILGITNTFMIKVNSLYGNVVFRALRFHYLLLFFIHSCIWILGGSKILNQTENRVQILMFSIILSVNCLLILLQAKSNSHPFNIAVPSIWCMLLVVLKGYWNVSMRMQPKGVEITLFNDFQRAQNYLWKPCSFGFLSSHCEIALFDPVKTHICHFLNKQSR